MTKFLKAVSRKNPDESFEFDLGDIKRDYNDVLVVANDDTDFMPLNIEFGQIIYYRHKGNWYEMKGENDEQDR